MQIIGMIIVGFIIGLLARFIYPGAINMGFWMTVAFGIGGSLVGGILGSLIWRSPDGKYHPAGWFLSLIGAIILLWVYLNFIAK
ncbi:MAG TPA: GlsB/YeaQ/YmgE family stress response membrane protein [Burkholderiales bacterium]